MKTSLLEKELVELSQKCLDEALKRPLDSEAGDVYLLMSDKIDEILKREWERQDIRSQLLAQESICQDS